MVRETAKALATKTIGYQTVWLIVSVECAGCVEIAGRGSQARPARLTCNERIAAGNDLPLPFKPVLDVRRKPGAGRHSPHRGDRFHHVLNVCHPKSHHPTAYGSCSDE